ncbi:ImmA/IrrE family metallo-endopeptidase [Paenibacillus azoreducens]|uniref:Membrane protein n=1 Tax=Paenibacillus azoreducens TaxID=116718 RepID=A0A919YJ32_9BACL|nr:ImmA/IrrE family metallo-endopeptidase [Paenibacillus azoreducens]GIO50225.1 membrane protein [Paenibacillus azoreducens]
MLYEELQKEAMSLGIDVFEMSFRGSSKGLYKNKSIGIRFDLNDRTEKACILAEELGHYHTSSGNILDQRDIRNRKQELRARQWAYERLVPLSSIVQAYKSNANGRFEIAEYLGVTEEFLQDSIDRYRDKYGILTSIDNYIIFLDPLRVVEVVA